MKKAEVIDLRDLISNKINKLIEIKVAVMMEEKKKSQ